MKITGIILAVLGVLALIGAILIPTVAVPAAKIGVVDSTDSTTYSTATAKVLNESKLVAAVAAKDPAQGYDNVNLESTRLTKSVTDNADAQKEGASVFDTKSVNIDTATGQPFPASPGGEAVFAFKPLTSELVNCCGANLGGKTVNMSGNMPLKFPFNSPKSDLQVFNTDIQAPVTTKYVDTVNQYGMELYRYTQDIPATIIPADKPLISIPKSLAGIAVGVFAPDKAALLNTVPDGQNVDLWRYTSAKNEFLVEPKSGQIVDGHLVNTDTARFKGGTEDILTVAVVDGKSAQVEEGAKDIKASADLLSYASMAPWILGIIGLILLVIGILLISKGGKKKKAAAASTA